ncbi:hypothetical protein Hrd1104_00610 [Halorhabdus sp. CBA1104]|uniref:hypothetical protein n=1 Tax=Halorhabdus sp. CBA1104 TaxID=1380432 RepID=UPI0012B42249|nr:hypothetical protein [Halorhabdus sp. CBA1104]QGN05938.1 hypothetical protein Hrd1104_00610 [Halorhabdus sp. CBA1104]
MVDPRWIPALGMEAAVVAILVWAIRRRDLAVATNAFAGALLVVTPFVAAPLLDAIGSQRPAIGPLLPSWIALASLLHAIGMLGVYESTWWWDHLTHTVSAALVAALVYGGAVVALGETTGATMSPRVITVTTTLLVGVLWEGLELLARAIGDRLDVEPVLVHYGWLDTALDLVFDVVGAVLVVAFDVRVFVPVGEALLGVG